MDILLSKSTIFRTPVIFKPSRVSKVVKATGNTAVNWFRHSGGSFSLVFLVRLHLWLKVWKWLSTQALPRPTRPLLVPRASLDFVAGNLNIPNYSFEYVPTPLFSGGVGMYINERLQYSVLEKTSTQSYQALWIEIHSRVNKNIICGIIYRQHNCPKDFLSYFDNALENYSNSGKILYVFGDFNIDLLKFETCSFSQDFLLSLQSCYLLIL